MFHSSTFNRLRIPTAETLRAYPKLMRPAVPDNSPIQRWSGPIRPTIAAGVWHGSEARRAGARPGMHAKAGGKERCLRHSARASTYGQAVLRTQSNLINARPARARSHYYNRGYVYQRVCVGAHALVALGTWDGRWISLDGEDVHDTVRLR